MDINLKVGLKDYEELERLGYYVKGDEDPEYPCTDLSIKISRLLLSAQRENGYKQLLRWRNVGKEMLEFLELQTKIDKHVNNLLREYEGAASRNKNKRWSELEESLLIELVCSGATMTDIAVQFGRTPQAISTKVSQLVGVSKLSEEIAGHFIGTLNGAEINGNIAGTLNKGKMT